MDFNINTTMPSAYHKPLDEQISGELLQKKEPVIEQPVQKEIEIPKNEYLETQKIRVQEEFISDLKEIQNVLFVMIGSDLKLSNQEEQIGLAVNMVA